MRITFLGNFSVDYSSESHHAKTLECLGHNVMRLQEKNANSEKILSECLQSDLFIWIHTHGWETTGRPMKEILAILKQKNIPSLTYHLDLWLGLQREKDMNKDDYWHIQHFFTVDKLMADWLNINTRVKGHYIQAAVFHDECYMADPDITNDVIFVGSKGYHPEWQYRPMLINWLKDKYGDKFKHFGGDGLGVMRGKELNQLYANSKIVVGDTLCLNYNYPYYWSDRVYETIGRGGFIIHPYIKGMEEHFTDNKHLQFYNYNDMTGLQNIIDYYLQNDAERELIRKQGFEYVKQNHTYLQRWIQILRSI